MKIAVLAWGSVVWNRGGLKTVGDFEPVGPTLPIEFCRISGGGRLTLVISERHGQHCKTYAARSAFADLDGALRDLWLRESRLDATVPANIRDHPTVTYVDIKASEIGSRARRHLKVADMIAVWASANAYEAVIWTALGAKFKDEIQVPFSVDAAMAYLATLESARQADAFEYIRRAPPEIQTPVRAAFDRRWPSQ